MIRIICRQPDRMFPALTVGWDSKMFTDLQVMILSCALIVVSLILAVGWGMKKPTHKTYIYKQDKKAKRR